MCAELKLRIDKYAARQVIFYGDLEHGKSRSVSATAHSWEIIRREFALRNCEFRLKPHPRIVDRVNAVNSKHRSAAGQVSFGLDPKCIELHKDFEMVDMAMLTKQANVGERTHASDAIGYMIAYEYSIITPQKWTTI